MQYYIIGSIFILFIIGLAFWWILSKLYEKQYKKKYVPYKRYIDRFIDTSLIDAEDNVLHIGDIVYDFVLEKYFVLVWDNYRWILKDLNEKEDPADIKHYLILTDMPNKARGAIYVKKVGSVFNQDDIEKYKQRGNKHDNNRRYR